MTTTLCLRTLLRAVSFVLLAFTLLLSPSPFLPSAAARSGDDTFTTAATGLVQLGSADPRWLAAPVSLEEGDEVDDPGDGMPGFLVADRGEVLVVDDDGRETLMESGDARFVAEGDELTLRPIDGDADLWRIGVTTSSAGDPLEGSDAIVGETLVAHSGADDGADSAARRKISLRIGTIEDGDSATAGGDDESVPFLIAMDGDLLVGDEDDLDEGQVAAEPEAGRDGSVDLEADGDAVVGYVAVGPALDPDTLTDSGRGSSSNDENDRDDDQDTDQDGGGSALPTATSTPVPANDPPPAGDTDTDGDGLTDAEEAALGTSPNDVDSDGDDAWDTEETAKGTDPLNPDSDFDGFPDGVELPPNSDTDPLNLDSDFDGIIDGDEESCEVVPGEQAGRPHVECTDEPAPDPNADSDQDSLSDSEEAALGSDPNNKDTDGDRLEDGYEVSTSHSDPTKADSDSDSLSDIEELNLQTDPMNRDSDGDRLEDGYEVSASHTNPAMADSDQDLISDIDEINLQTDPNVVDTDGDGFSDGVEVEQGTDPTDPNSHVDI